MNNNPKLYKEQKNTIKYLTNELNLDKMYLYRFVGNHDKIKKMPYDIVLQIAKVESIEPNELYNKMVVYSLKNPK